MRTAVQWLAPGFLLAFLPKCPLCLAGYVAVLTGVGVSLTAATYLRLALLIGSMGMLAYVLGRQIHYLAIRKE